RIGALVSGDEEAYTYLPESVAQFLRPRELANAMHEAGLDRIRYRRLGVGSVALHVGVKPSELSTVSGGEDLHRGQAIPEDRQMLERPSGADRDTR
ncbi:MAG: class I SAM-dependent methyltransferase, partial [Thermomicrobiales bacterium]|nr:class I SAM-dependent methyltransferase [Thermomicrobiales bacterium]